MPIVLIRIFYQSKVPSFVRCGLQNILKSQTFRLLDPAPVSRGQLKQKDILFSRETNRHSIIFCTYKTGRYCVRQVPSLSPLPICLPSYCFILLLAPWPTPLFPVLLLPVLRRSTTTILGTVLRQFTGVALLDCGVDAVPVVERRDLEFCGRWRRHRIVCEHGRLGSGLRFPGFAGRQIGSRWRRFGIDFSRGGHCCRGNAVGVGARAPASDADSLQAVLLSRGQHRGL